MKKYLATLILLMGILPVVSFADNSGCQDFKVNLKFGSNDDPATKVEVLKLQSALVKEGFKIGSGEFGNFGNDTLAAVKSFQEKYLDDILAPFGLTSGSGFVGRITRLKLQVLYGCRPGEASKQPSAATPPSSAQGASLSVSNLTLSSSGVTATFCNNGKDIDSAPFRIRLNGINRDFEIASVRKGGACDTETYPYETWGLTFDQGSTFTAVSIIDPAGIYKTGSFVVPLNQTATLSVPAVPGYHLSVRSILLKTTGIQATLCNLGTIDVTSFPVKVTVNGSATNFDVSGAYKTGKCFVANWDYSNFGITYSQGISYAVMVQVDPNNIYKETNEFDNAATVVGTP